MSDSNLISPLLDGFMMGEPISDHDGVCCCPAMKENSDDKYIVKIISIPSSQKQLDALLLTGAYRDVGDAMEYFKELTDDVAAEAEFLGKLAAGKGYLPYLGWQIVPMEKNQLGYKVYLLSRYHRSLDRYVRRNPMTHLGAVNLGLDLCAALNEARKAGCLYVGVKPTNIFVDEQKHFLLGDLGFIPLDSLQFATLPSKYRSPYVAPELDDPMATINITSDVYSVGLVLYELFNDDQLPPRAEEPGQPLPAPLNADYEMAEIILKACAPDPKDRWQSPAEMGAALVAYMQRNIVNDTPIVPPTVEQPLEETEPAPLLDDQETEVPEEPVAPELEFLEDLISDETAPGQEEDDAQAEGKISEEIDSMLAQADELISHEAPEPVVPPDPAEIHLPDPLPAEEEEAESENAEQSEEPETEDTPAEEAPAEEAPAEETPSEEPPAEEAPAAPAHDPSYRPELFVEEPLDDDPDVVKKKRHHWVLPVLLVLLLLLGGGYWFYQNIYLQPIDKLEVNPVDNYVTVTVSSPVEESALTLVCTDTYGNTLRSPVQDGKATFTALNPGTQYKVTVEIDGFHEVSGSTSASFTTKEQSKVVNFAAVAGTEDGSVILNFSVDGKDVQDWEIAYVTEGQEEQKMTFSGHTVTIPGLTVGQVYKFTLIPTGDLYLVGETTLEYTPSNLIVAENIKVASCTNTTMTIQWDTPADATVESWKVRCYTEDGYDQTVTVTENLAEFTDISVGAAYTVEVTAAGMTQNARAFVTANPISITAFNVTPPTEHATSISVSWTYDGVAADAGWILSYTLDESTDAVTINASESKADIPLYPGVTYHFTIQSADGTSVFNGEHSYDCAEAPEFDAYGIHPSDLDVQMCKTPSRENWTYRNVKKSSYTSTFAPGESASMVIHVGARFYRPEGDPMRITYIVRDSSGNTSASLIGTQNLVWREMWSDSRTGLTIPSMPTAEGEYTVSVYFNGEKAFSEKFTVKS